MTIEIKQLIIRAVADARREPAAHPAGPITAVTPAPTRPAPDTDRAARSEDRDAIVAACVREVLRRLERKRER